MFEFARRLATLFRRTHVERGLDEEIRFHLEQQTAKNIRDGMSPDAARRAALVRFGGVEQVKEAARDEFRAGLLEDFGRDLRYGARVLIRAPGFAVVSILTLGLGIGAATAVFSVVDGVLLKPLPYPDPDRIVRLFQIDANGRRNNTVSEPNFEDWKNGTRMFRAMAEMSVGAAPAVVSGQSSMITGAAVSREFFDVMGVSPIIGRGFEESEQRVGGTPAAVVSHRFWQARLGGAPLSDQSLRVGEMSYQIVGVMPPGFDYPSASEYWTPRELNPPQRARTADNFLVVARLADQAPLATAQAEISALSRSLKTRYGDETWMVDAAAVPLREQLTSASRSTVLTLFGAAVMLLAISCLNVSNLLLARVANRRREMAVRLAIGAGRWRIARQLLGEVLVLCLTGGAAGALIAFAGGALLALQPGNLARIDNVSVNWTVMTFALAVSVLAAILLTIAATLRTGDRELKTELAESQRTAAGGRASQRVREVLSVSQVALTLVLLIGAALLTRSFVRVLTVNPGYRTDSALVLDMTSPGLPNAEGNMDGDLRGFRIVGIVGDVRELTPEALPGALFYGYYQQRVASRFSVIVRGESLDATATAAQQIVRQLDPNLPVQTRRIEEAFERSLAGRRFSLILIGAFSLSALILAMLGIYGLIAYLVAQPTREIGIRMALGASSRDLLRLILGKGATLAVAGTALGLALALGLSKLVDGLLYGITARDPIAFGGVAAITLAAVLLASYLPARRALTVAPVESLRS